MREAYIQIRKSTFEAQQKGQQPIIPMDWFYGFYLNEFENLPKTKKFIKKDMFGNAYIDDEGQIIWEELTTTQLPPQIFSQQFGIILMGYFEDIMDFLDKKFNVNWLCDKEGKKIKFVD